MAAHKTPDPLPLQTQSRDAVTESPASPLVRSAAVPELEAAEAFARHQRAHSLATPASPSFVVVEHYSAQQSQPPLSPVYAQDDALVGPSVVPQHQKGRVASLLETEGRRQRSNSLPLPLKRVAVEPPLPCRSTPPLSPQPRLPPLAYHHVITLHQLNLPRPALAQPNSRTAVAHYQAANSGQLVLPSIEPPITHASLKELDLIEVMRNPQLRHDVVFDPHLMFRPNFDGERGAKKRAAAERYWEAVAAEVERGCRCATWAPSSTDMLPCVCNALGISTSAVDALVHGGRRQAEQARRRRSSQPHLATAPALASRLPSRIPALVEELRLILTSLLPAPVHQTTSNAQQISAVLDAELISQQAEHGILDVLALADFLGTTLKLHCAPMRDEAVDEMVAQVQQGQIAGGLRMCFELLELMKLDIANHQLRSLRPFLLETATDFELKHLYDVHEQGVMAFDRTRRWFFAAVSRLADRSIARAVCDGLLELTFRPDCLAPAPRSPTKTRMSAAPAQSQLPETLHLDVTRLQSFHADVTDVSIVCMLLLLYRQLCSTTTGRRQPSEGELDRVRRELWVLISQSTPPRSPRGVGISQSGQSAPLSSPLPGQSKLENIEWRECLQDAALQIARRVNGAESPRAEEQELVIGWLNKHLTPTSELYRMVQTRLRCALTEMLEEQQSAILFGNVALLGLAPSPSSMVEMSAEVPSGCVRREAMTTSRSSSSDRSGKRRRSDEEDEPSGPVSKRLRIDAPLPDPAACLKPLMFEVRTLSERIAKVAAVHLRVYSGWYAALLSGGLPPTLIIHSATTSSGNSECSASE